MPLVDVSNAITFFDELPGRLQAPSFHPDYVMSDAKRSKSIKPTFFVRQSGGELFYHAFHAESIPGTDLIDVQSPYGYGGPIATTADERFLADAWAEYDQWCQENRVLAEFLRFHPCLKNWRYFSGDVIHDRKTVWIDLTRADLMSGYAARSRTSIRKAVANSVDFEWVTPESFLGIFPGLYESAMKTLGAAESYYFPRSYFESIVASNIVWMGLCRKDSETVSGAIFLVGEDLIEYHLSASSALGKALASTNLLIHRAAERGQDEGKTIFHLGGGTDSSEENRLLFFKRGFSGQTAEFKIGRKVHHPAIYDNLRRNWESEVGTSAKRVLFYRTSS